MDKHNQGVFPLDEDFECLADWAGAPTARSANPSPFKSGTMETANPKRSSAADPVKVRSGVPLWPEKTRAYPLQLTYRLS